MRWPQSLQGRLGLFLGVLLSVLWIATASVTAVILRDEVDEVFDSALQETALRLLPLAVVDIVGREEDGITQELGAIREQSDFFSYIVRDAKGRILLQSYAAEAAIFPVYDGAGFAQTATHRFYNSDALQGTITITVAEPLKHRASVAREIQIALGLPLLIVVPLAVVTIIFAVKSSFVPLRRFGERLDARSARDLSPVPQGDIPSEIRPVVNTLNRLLGRLKTAFEAERSFAANAAHEIRSPLAGAIAQAQRLQSETSDQNARARAVEIETTLKRLTKLSERLMQLARAEGGPLRLDRWCDLGLIARLVVDDVARTAGHGRIKLTLPKTPVMSDLDPDAFGILCRNLVENALRHGSDVAPVEITVTPDGELIVANDGPIVPPDTMNRLTARFERAGASADGSGLGLAIVAAIAERIECPLLLKSPRPGALSGFEASIKLPVIATNGSVRSDLSTL